MPDNSPWITASGVVKKRVAPRKATPQGEFDPSGPLCVEHGMYPDEKIVITGTYKDPTTGNTYCSFLKDEQKFWVLMEGNSTNLSIKATGHCTENQAVDVIRLLEELGSMATSGNVSVGITPLNGQVD